MFQNHLPAVSIRSCVVKIRKGVKWEKGDPEPTCGWLERFRMIRRFLGSTRRDVRRRRSWGWGVYNTEYNNTQYRTQPWCEKVEEEGVRCTMPWLSDSCWAAGAREAQQRGQHGTITLCCLKVLVEKKTKKIKRKKITDLPSNQEALQGGPTKGSTWHHHPVLLKGFGRKEDEKNKKEKKITALPSNQQALQGDPTKGPTWHHHPVLLWS